MTPWPGILATAQALRRSLDPTPEDIALDVRPVAPLPALLYALHVSQNALQREPLPGQADAHQAVAELVASLSFGLEELLRDLRDLGTAEEMTRDIAQLLGPH